MKLSQPALSLLEETIKQAIGKYACGCEQTVVTDTVSYTHLDRGFAG